MREILSYSFVIPPTLFIVTCLAGAVIAFRHPSIGNKIVFTSALALYLFSTPAASTLLLQQLIVLIPQNPDLKKAQAIVIPGADIKVISDDRVSPAVGPMTLERLASAAKLYAELHLPIAVTGGPVSESPVPLATLMRNELEHLFAVPVSFTETRSQNTFENAMFVSRLLNREHIDTVIIVVQARDMYRVLWSFDKVSLRALPYCTDSCYRNPVRFSDIADFLPSASALRDSYYAFHEIIGTVYYKLVY